MKRGPLPSISLRVRLKLSGWWRNMSHWTEWTQSSRLWGDLSCPGCVWRKAQQTYSPPNPCNRTWLVSLLQVLSYPPPQLLSEVGSDASVISASTKGRCEGNTYTRLKPLLRTNSLRAGLRYRSQRKCGFLFRFILVQNAMSCSGGGGWVSWLD